MHSYGSYPTRDGCGQEWRERRWSAFGKRWLFADYFGAEQSTCSLFFAGELPTLHIIFIDLCTGLQIALLYCPIRKAISWFPFLSLLKVLDGFHSYCAGLQLGIAPPLPLRANWQWQHNFCLILQMDIASLPSAQTVGSGWFALSSTDRALPHPGVHWFLEKHQPKLAMAWYKNWYIDVYCGSEEMLSGNLVIVHEYGRKVEAWQLENDFQQVSAKLRRLIKAYKYKYVLNWSTALAQEVFRCKMLIT